VLGLVLQGRGILADQAFLLVVHNWSSLSNPDYVPVFSLKVRDVSLWIPHAELDLALSVALIIVPTTQVMVISVSLILESGYLSIAGCERSLV